MRCYLGLDCGGTATKAALFDARGRELGAASVPTRVLTPRPGWAERDMEGLWQDGCRVIRQVLAETKTASGDVAAAAVCGHGKGLYLWGRDGSPARPGILSADSRAAAYAEGWRADGTEAALFPRTYQHILPCQPTALLAWVRDHEPETAKRVRWVFSCKDYLRFRFTGIAGAELTDLSGTGLLNLHSRGYDGAVTEALGLGRFAGALPPVCASGAVCGQVTREAAALTGLREGTPVAGGMFDIDACALALGVTAPGTACMIAGTWSINEYLSESPVLDGSTAMNSLFCLPEYYLVEESSPTSAGNLRWFLDTLLPEARAGAVEEGRSIYDVVNGLAASLPPGEPCPVFLPFLAGSAEHAGARGCLAGLSLSHTRAHLVRGVYEGVVFSHKWHFQRLCRAGGGERRWDHVRLAGGAARSPVWAQMFADVLEYPVEAVAVSETGALGCAMAAAAAVGDFPSLRAAAGAMSPPGVRLEPNGAASAAYRHKYRLYLRAVDALGGSWDTEEAPDHV